MFGFSIPKLAILILIVVTVWYGFKFFGKRSELRNQESTYTNNRQLQIIFLISLLGLIVVAIIWATKTYFKKILIDIVTH